MSIKIYCDTNIYLDYLLNRNNLFGKNIGDRAFSVFNRSLSCEFEIIVSSWTLVELKNKVEFGQINTLFSFLKRKIVKVEHTPEDIEKAKILSAHFQDALHAILANKAGASFLITRDLKGFLAYETLVKVKLPENL
ncbi:MAG: PIN domain-containing protein [Nanoarchaeota archaeon]|nr:PIN domain-containing protein [Nanoarchaeota archaeon]MBU4299884.1 PIN domain-containing protein [Nanoarchaeota archaeon]MBU4452337.1 PIN domain-containing protein [Nanoarchaeota archaeon]MCG2724539.1 PIN domain-containing protein [archaeon]